jgi:hypothetical protein
MPKISWEIIQPFHKGLDYVIRDFKDFCGNGQSMETV